LNAHFIGDNATPGIRFGNVTRFLLGIIRMDSAPERDGVSVFVFTDTDIF